MNTYPHITTKWTSVIVALIAALAFAMPAGGQLTDTTFSPHSDDSQSEPPMISIQRYTEENPLVYEGAQDLWPYSFLNENGEPDGFNVDLIKLILNRLDIPFEIRMKPRLMAFRDLKEGKSDLMIGLVAGFHEEYSQYSQNAVTLFTQSVLSPKSAPTEIHNFRDLATHRVYVNDSSLCHHLMIDYGWGDNAIPTRTIGETIRKMSNDNEGEMVWNTISLKWMLRKFQIDNLEITPINMPHGEYRFMSHNTALLHLLDSVCTVMNTGDELLPLQNKWFFPERQKAALPAWVKWAVAATLLILLLVIVYFIVFRWQLSKMNKKNLLRNRRLALVLNTSHVRIWTYDIRRKLFEWRNENGQTASTYTMDEFATRYSHEDFLQLKDALLKLAHSTPDEADPHITLELKAKDVEGGDQEVRDYYIVLSILERNNKGMPTVIIGTKKDVTSERQQKRQADERKLRYWSIFQTPSVGILLFDKNEQLTNINDKACEMLGCTSEEIISEHVSLNDIFAPGSYRITPCDGFYATHIADYGKNGDLQSRVKSIRLSDKVYIEYHIICIKDDAGKTTGFFAICRDVAHIARSKEKYNRTATSLYTSEEKLKEYIGNIDSVLHESDVRLATYSPSTHTLTIHRSVYEVQHALTQTRCMTLVDDYSKNQAMRMLNAMDDRVKRPISVDILTTLRIKGGIRLCLHFSLMPVTDKQGNIVEYLGLCRDKSELNDIRKQMGVHTAMVQEVETTQNRFINNMVKEIRTPMDIVLKCVQHIHDEVATADEAAMLETIIANSEKLLHLIDNILYLSRLQAHMVEINKQPRNFAETFEAQCQNGWEPYRNADTRYIVETNYEKLVVDIDIDNLGRAIQQVAANAAQHTHSGTVKARYEYIGRRLVISIDDTGVGIPKNVLEHINSSDKRTLRDAHGLGLSITKELVSQMGGTVDITSEEGVGTTVYITIPCHAYEMNRKKHF
ncbi:MAG: transporter substrate-binding domain-containing protein [Prevotella sp.]|nr:transporter substrate-binding domain-containing protein [Prevotella sp.]